MSIPTRKADHGRFGMQVPKGDKRMGFTPRPMPKSAHERRWERLAAEPKPRVPENVRK